MTVCLAALCSDRNTIVIAADRKISTPVMEAEFATSKIDQIHPNWWLLMAANDVSPVFPIVDEMRLQLADKPAPTAVEAQQALEQAFNKERIRRTEAAILSPFGMTLPQFLVSRSNFGDIIFQGLQQQLAQYRLNCGLMVVGFDDEETGHILTIDDSRIVQRHDRPGFWAVGSGAVNALSMMFFHAVDNTDSVEQTLYHVVAAKNFAEYSPGVGSETELILLRPSGRFHRFGRSNVVQLERLWLSMWYDENGIPKHPDNLRRRVRTIVRRSLAADLPATESATGSDG